MKAWVRTWQQGPAYRQVLCRPLLSVDKVRGRVARGVGCNCQLVRTGKLGHTVYMYKYTTF